MASRVEQMDALVRELSCQDDADRLIRVFGRQSDLLYPRDGLVTVSRRDLDPPHYRITQSYLYAGGSPYCWFVGFCSYEGKTAWVTDKAPVRKFDKFAQ